ncbi:MAG: phytanoyl-CoA dioxygenase family protein [Pseudonocardia sp.]|nr:phytanoyl-CoA dioxygenase family protein [Pseudonocardia sp.]
MPEDARAALLTRADALRRDGALVELVDVLTSANRIHPTPEIERELVDVRHRAAAATVAPTAPDHQPLRLVPSGPDGSLPRVERAAMTVDAVRAGLSRAGCVLIPGLIPPGRVDALVAGIDRAFAAFDDAQDGPDAVGGDDDVWYSPFTPQDGDYRVGGRRNWMRASGGMWAADSPRMLFDLIDVLHDVGLGQLVTDYLGERPALSANKCNLRRVPVDSDGAWHQDGAFLGEQVPSLNVWIALSDCGRIAPTMDVVPRRFDHVLPTGTDGIPFDWAVAPEVVAREAGDVGVIRPEFAAGDVLLFDHLFLHRTASDPTMTAERHALETWFFAPSAYPGGQIPLLF